MKDLRSLIAEYEKNLSDEFIRVTREALTFDVKALSGIKDFPELKVDFRIGTNYQDMIQEAHWLRLAEDNKAPSSSESPIKEEGLSEMGIGGTKIKKVEQMERQKGGEHVDSSDGHFVENISSE